MSNREMRFEGLTEDEVLALSKEEVNALILIGEPVVFRAGSATILGSFKRRSNRLVLELAQIEGGGEGVLISLASLSKRYAKVNGLEEIEWIVHAVTCAQPNEKLRRVLKHRGFVINNLAGIGEAYHLVESV